VNDASDYLRRIKALILLTPQIEYWESVREETQGDVGLFRCRLSLQDGALIEMFELFRVVEGEASIDKYSFHWQDAAGRLIKRWDNAPHHPELVTYPDHVHDGKTHDVLSHKPMDVEAVLDVIALKPDGGRERSG
jgi:hypothetical protein